MRRVALVVFVLLALAGCGSAPAEVASSLPSSEPSAVVAADSAAPSYLPEYATSVADLPSAPPVEAWVVKGSDFQQTLDLNMQTAMIERLMMSPSDADETAARDLAYYVCRSLRQYPSQPGSAWVEASYPGTETIDAIGVALAAQAYCLDTVVV